MSTLPTPSEDEKSEFLLSCRYGELDEVRQFVETYGARTALTEVVDDNGNTPMHMVAGNGHEDVLAFLLSRIPQTPSEPEPEPDAATAQKQQQKQKQHPPKSLTHQILRAQNSAGSTPLHWAALNAHLAILQSLTSFSLPHNGNGDGGGDGDGDGDGDGAGSGEGTGVGVDLLDIQNAAGLTPLGEAERSGWAEGARWIVGVMNLHPASTSASTSQSAADGADDADDDAMAEEDVNDIEVEIEDADGGIAKLSLSGKDLQQQQTGSAGGAIPPGAAS